ncbi:MAG: oligogalacturonate lyase [Steroidobacteraceae bacterium]|jgi:oligogalacturonide lyase|nr:oligogalacturonate lyase [Steroidobacteraceae bacterium]
MKVALGRAAVVSMLFAMALPGAEAAAAPPTEWVDAATGHRVIRLSTEAGTRSIYFHQNSITPDGRFVLVEMKDGLGVIEIATRRNTRLVDGNVRALFVGRKTGLIYFSRGEDAGRPEQQKQVGIYTVMATGGKPKLVATIPLGSIGSINADETLLLGSYAEREWQLEQGPRDPRFEANYAATGKDGKPLTFAEAKEVRLLQREQAQIPMKMFTVNTKTGEQKIIHESTAWLGHLQFSLTDPQLLMFCHEGPWHRVDRIWTMKLGGEPRLMHQRTMNMEIAGHEFFDNDGKTVWYDLQTPRGEVFWLANVTPEGKRTWYKVERDQWSVHFQIAPDGKTFAGDGGDEEMVAHAKDGKWLYRFTPRAIPDVAGISAPNAGHLVHPGTLEAEKLVDMRNHDYRLEPNLHFTPDMKHLIFRSNLHGEVHTYMVELAKAGS